MNSRDDLSEFENLWTTDINEYVLLGSDEDLASDNILKCSIFNRKTKMVLVIEDDVMGIEVKKLMKRAGVPIKTWKMLSQYKV
jgi:hypothetical protein